MVDVDFDERVPVTSVLRPGHLDFWFGAGAVVICALIDTIAVLAYGRNGSYFGVLAETSGRVATVVFALSLAVRPLLSLGLRPRFGDLQIRSYTGVLAFGVAEAVYLACLALLSFASGAPAPPFTALSGFFSAIMLAAMLITHSDRSFETVGDQTKGLIHRLAIAYFWVVFSIIALAHLYGPHRPDGYYGFSLGLLVVGLLSLFADDCYRRARHARSDIEPRPLAIPRTDRKL